MDYFLQLNTINIKLSVLRPVLKYQEICEVHLCEFEYIRRIRIAFKRHWGPKDLSNEQPPPRLYISVSAGGER